MHIIQKIILKCYKSLRFRYTRYCHYKFNKPWLKNLTQELLMRVIIRIYSIKVRQTKRKLIQTPVKFHKENNEWNMAEVFNCFLSSHWLHYLIAFSFSQGCKFSRLSLEFRYCLTAACCTPYCSFAFRVQSRCFILWLTPAKQDFYIFFLIWQIRLSPPPPSRILDHQRQPRKKRRKTEEGEAFTNCSYSFVLH